MEWEVYHGLCRAWEGECRQESCTYAMHLLQRAVTQSSHLFKWIWSRKQLSNQGMDAQHTLKTEKFILFHRDRMSCSPGCLKTWSAAEAHLECISYLFPLPKHWDYRCSFWVLTSELVLTVNVVIVAQRWKQTKIPQNYNAINYCKQFQTILNNSILTIPIPFNIIYWVFWLNFI